MSDDAQFLSVTAQMATPPDNKVWIYRLNKAAGTYSEIQTIRPVGTAVEFGYAMTFSGE